MTTPRDLIKQAAEREIKESDLDWQIRMLESGTKHLMLDRPCKKGDGIAVLENDRFDKLISLYSEAKEQGRLIKFVPASGAASRMFRDLEAIKNSGHDLSIDLLKTEACKGDDSAAFALGFFQNIEEFAFLPELEDVVKANELSLKDLLEQEKLREILEMLLDEKGLGYSSMLKGMIPFHRYSNRSHTPFEEHLTEEVKCVTDSAGTVRVHFTIPSGQLDFLKTYIGEAIARVEKNGIQLDVSLSEQSKSTDTIALDKSDSPFMLNEDEYLFRPGGHGALLKNLNNLDADILLIKNIDNIVPEPCMDESVHYWKILTGYLLEIQKKIHSWIKRINDGLLTDALANEILKFLCETVFCNIPDNWGAESIEFKGKFLLGRLDRPIRVCGMVENKGDPGGGPFWVKHPDGRVTPQIVEKEQVNFGKSDQRNVFKSATHFNPVILVCGVKDYKGWNYDLQKYCDRDAVFISNKSINGKSLKALELPGLWNGSMAWWNTIFVDVPYGIFNPVKIVNDLLKEGHKFPDCKSDM